MRAAGAMARWEYSDEEWAQWRREQNQGSRPNPSPAPAPAAPVTTTAGLSTQRPLPDVWKVSYEPRPASEANKPRSKKDASDVVRLCNRRLQSMWNDWQNQVEAEKAKVTSTLALSFQSMACGQITNQNANQQTADLQAQLKECQKQVAEMKAARRAELDMAHEASELKLAEAKREAKDKYAAKIAGIKAANAAYKGRVHKVGVRNKLGAT